MNCSCNRQMVIYYVGDIKIQGYLTWQYAYVYKN